MTMFPYSRLCFLAILVVALCLQTVNSDDNTDGDTNWGNAHPNVRPNSDVRPNATFTDDAAINGGYNGPNMTDTTPRGLSESDNTSNNRPTNNPSTGVPRIPSVSPIAGENVTAPVIATSTSTTAAQLENNMPLGANTEKTANIEINSTEITTQESSTQKVTTPAKSWWENIFGSSSNTKESTVAPVTSTMLNNVTTEDVLNDSENMAGLFEDNSTLSNGTNFGNVTGTNKVNSTLLSSTANPTDFDNSTSSNESGISLDTFLDEMADNSTTTDGPFRDNSTTINGTAGRNSTLPNWMNVGNVNNTGNETTSNSTLTTAMPGENSTLTTPKNGTKISNATTGDNSTLTTQVPTNNSSLSEGGFGFIPNGTVRDNSTSSNGTDNRNTTLPSGTTLPNGTTTDNSTKVSTETTTSLPDTSIPIPDVPGESEIIKESLPGGCSDSLGLENGAGRLTASDWSPGFLPEEARLNGRSGWVGGFVDIHYIQAELNDIQGVSGLRLQPHAQWHRNVIQQFRLLYSLDGYHWSKYKYTRNNKTYSVVRTALDEHTSESLHVFNPPLQARFVVINPVKWVGNPGPALRFELYGCKSTVSASTIVVPRVFRGEMQKETTWEAGVPYLVDQMVRIWPGVTFRILPGVEVYFTNPQAGFLVEGAIVAEGKANKTIAFESGHVLSHLTIGPFWKGLHFVNSENRASTLSNVVISGAAIGIEATANSVTLKDADIHRCETGFRLEGGTQTSPNVIENSVFAHNKYGIHIQNVSGTVKLSGIHLRDQRVIGINGYFVFQPGSASNRTALTLSQISVENSSYAIYITGYNNLNLDVANTNIHDCHYGIYLDYSDAVPSIETSVRDSTFVKNRVYGLVVDYKHFARSSWYRGAHTFKTTVTNNVFDTGSNGVSYYSPEVLKGQESEFLLWSNTFRNLHSGTIVQAYELSTLQIQSNRYIENGGRALDVFYQAIGVKGLVKNNTFENNHAADNSNDTDIRNDTLIVLAGNSDAEMHGTLTFTENVITNNSFPHILESSLVSMDMLFNVFENKMADCEMCVRSLWVHGGKTLNASHNWWGTPKLSEATQRVSDFYRDMDVAAAEISPILREARVVGASWDTVPHRIVAGGSIADGGIIAGNVTANAGKILDIKATIYVPAGNVLNIPAGSHLRFAKDIGIVVEGQLHILGTEAKPVILEPMPKQLWKGIRLSYANETTISHMTMAQSRGIEASGCIPRMDSAILKQSTGPGVWITVIQPPPIEIRGVTFENGKSNGILLEVQGDGTAEVSVSVINCHVVGNNGSGVVIRAGNVIANVSFQGNTIANNSQDGAKIEMSNGRLKMADNKFRSSHPGTSAENKRLAHITFDARCQVDAVRDVEISENSFSEENSKSTPGSLLLETPCINTSSQWIVSGNTFSIAGPTAPEEEAMLRFNMADNTENRWPLQIEVSNNTFTCQNQVGSSVQLSAAHGETVVFRDNHIASCDSPLLVESRYLTHNLTISYNTFQKAGPIVLQAVKTVVNESQPNLNFSYNEIVGSTGEHEAVIKTTGYNAVLHYNYFENPEARHDLWVGDMAPVNATLNWWGTPDFNRIIARVFDGRTDYSRAQADIFPCLLSRNYSNISTANPDVFQITNNTIGGSVHGNITLPYSKNPYDVENPIRIPAGSSLTIPGGTTLLFHNHTGIFADGELYLDGNSSAWIDMKPVNDSTSWRGVTIGKPRQEFMKVRLSGSNLAYTGRVEAYVSGVWRGVCTDGFNMAAAHVVCKELSFFDAESITELASSQSSFGVSDVKCTGLEISLLDCNVRTGLEAKCKSGKTPVVVCQQEANKALSRTRRSTNTSTNVVSDNHPTILKFTRIYGADVGLQVNDNDGIELVSMNVTSSTGPSVVLSSRGAMGVHLTDCIVAKGGDVGVDIAGSCSVTMRGTNVTSNKLDGITVKVTGEESNVQFTDSVIRENGQDGIHVKTDRGFNITDGSVALNKKMGIVLDAATVAMDRTIVEDHVAGGLQLNLTDGQLSVKNCIFSNNGGHTIDATVSINSNGTDVAFIEFERTGFINGSAAKNGSHFSSVVVLRLDTKGAPTNGTRSIPVSFIESHILDSFGDGLWIEEMHGDLNLTIANSTFEHVEGTPIHVVTNNSAPELHFHGNAFHRVKNNTLLVDIEGS